MHRRIAASKAPVLPVDFLVTCWGRIARGRSRYAVLPEGAASRETLWQRDEPLGTFSPVSDGASGLETGKMEGQRGAKGNPDRSAGKHAGERTVAKRPGVRP